MSGRCSDTIVGVVVGVEVVGPPIQGAVMNQKQLAKIVELHDGAGAICARRVRGRSSCGCIGCFVVAVIVDVVVPKIVMVLIFMGLRISPVCPRLLFWCERHRVVYRSTAA